jgi:TusA-related sulfurtransferase
MDNIPDAVIDITNVVCPITFVKVKAALEELEDGQLLQVRLGDGEPVQNVPRSLKDEDHKVKSVKKNDDGTWTLTVIKGGLAN